MKPCILVTGGAGFIGSNFILHWIGSGKGKVVNLDKLTYAGSLNRLSSLAGNEDHLFVQGDIGDHLLIDHLLRSHRPRAIVHLAAETHVDRSIAGPELFLKTNIDGTFSMLSAALAYYQTLTDSERDRFRFLHVSTDEVYGSLEPDEPSSHEQSRYAPNSPYATSKAASDHLVRAWNRTYGLPTLTTNCSNNYGPMQFPEKLIPLTISRALAGQPLPLYGDGSQRRDWVYALDHCKAIATVLDGGLTGETYNIGGGETRTNLEVVFKICQMLDELIPKSPWVPHRQLIRFVEDRPGHDRCYAMDTRKMRHQLGWHPEESFDEGLRKTIAWHLPADSKTQPEPSTPANLAV